MWLRRRRPSAESELSANEDERPPWEIWEEARGGDDTYVDVDEALKQVKSENPHDDRNPKDSG